MYIAKYLDRGTLLVISVTFVLFAIALFAHGFTHDLLIEVAVFLVSVKLMLMAYKNSIYAKKIETKLDAIAERLDKLDRS